MRLKEIKAAVTSYQSAMYTAKGEYELTVNSLSVELAKKIRERLAPLLSAWGLGLTGSGEVIHQDGYKTDGELLLYLLPEVYDALHTSNHNGVRLIAFMEDIEVTPHPEENHTWIILRRRFNSASSTDIDICYDTYLATEDIEPAGGTLFGPMTAILSDRILEKLGYIDEIEEIEELLMCFKQTHLPRRKKVGAEVVAEEEGGHTPVWSELLSEKGSTKKDWIDNPTGGGFISERETPPPSFPL